MNRSLLVIVSGACLTTLALGQITLPTVRAQPKLIPDYSVRIDTMQTKRTAGGLEITGRIINTGRRALIYTSVVPVFVNDKGQEIGHGCGYLTTGPVGPGQAADFRATEPAPPKFAHLQMTLRERGVPVRVEYAPSPISGDQGVSP